MESGMKLLSTCQEEMFHNVVKDGGDYNLLRLLKESNGLKMKMRKFFN